MIQQIEQTDYSIPVPNTGNAAEFSAKAINDNLRRWLWSPCVKIDFRDWTGSRYVGHDFLLPRIPTPFETINCPIPTEIPAFEIVDGEEIPIDHTFKPGRNGGSMTMTKSAARCASDVRWQYEKIGVVELTGLTGLETKDVIQFYDYVLPRNLKNEDGKEIDTRSTLLKAYNRLTDLASREDLAIPSNWQTALREISEGVATAFFYWSDYLDNSEAEVQASSEGKVGNKNKLDALDLYLLKELERTPKALEAVKANEQLGKELAKGIIEGINKGARPSNVEDAPAVDNEAFRLLYEKMMAMEDALQTQSAELESLRKKNKG